SSLWTLEPPRTSENKEQASRHLHFQSNPLEPSLLCALHLHLSFSVPAPSFQSLARSHPAYSSQQKEENARFSHLKRNSGTNQFKDPEGRRKKKEISKGPLLLH
ncbi:hypothetical protein PRUPE_1G550500, partial [Prunus persica]